MVSRVVLHMQTGINPLDVEGLIGFLSKRFTDVGVDPVSAMQIAIALVQRELSASMAIAGMDYHVQARVGELGEIIEHASDCLDILEKRTKQLSIASGLFLGLASSSALYVFLKWLGW